MMMNPGSFSVLSKPLFFKQSMLPAFSSNYPDVAKPSQPTSHVSSISIQTDRTPSSTPQLPQLQKDTVQFGKAKPQPDEEVQTQFAEHLRNQALREAEATLLMVQFCLSYNADKGFLEISDLIRFVGNAMKRQLPVSNLPLGDTQPFPGFPWTEDQVPTIFNRGYELLQTVKPDLNLPPLPPDFNVLNPNPQFMQRLLADYWENIANAANDRQVIQLAGQALFASEAYQTRLTNPQGKDLDDLAILQATSPLFFP